MRKREASAATRHNTRIRKARLADANILAALSCQLGYPTTPSQIGRRLIAIRRDPRHSVAVAEWPGGRVIGWVHVFIHRVLESEPRAELGGLVVDQDYRGSGIGAKLVEWAERWAKARRLGAICLRSNIVRKDAHRFYRRLGYRIVKTQHALVKQL